METNKTNQYQTYKVIKNVNKQIILTLTTKPKAINKMII